MTFEKYCSREGLFDVGAFRNLWDAAQKEEREACAHLLNLSFPSAALMVGEMTAQEWRTVGAVLKALQARMRSNAGLGAKRG